MKDEYIIISKTAIQKRIEELEKELSHHNEWYEKARENYHQERKSWGQADDGEMRVASDAASTTAQEIKILKQILSQSTPLIPEIEKAFDAGKNTKYSIGCNADGIERICYCKKTQDCQYPIYPNKQDYTSNLKLNI